MKVCVFGAGAVGGHLAARFAYGDAQVSVIARGAHLEALRRDGLRVNLPDRTLHCTPKASDRAEQIGPQDVVVVAVKTTADVGSRRASSVFEPGLAPSVQLPRVAYPFASVETVAAVAFVPFGAATDPPPPFTVNAIARPFTGLSLASSTRTRGGVAVAVPTAAERLLPPAITMRVEPAA